MSHSHDSEPEFEKLSKAITEAVMTSEKVRRVVEEIQKKDENLPSEFHGFSPLKCRFSQNRWN